MRFGVCKGHRMKKYLTGSLILLDPKLSYADTVRYVRTEFGKETNHLSDEDCLEYYKYYLNTRRT